MTAVFFRKTYGCFYVSFLAEVMWRWHFPFLLFTISPFYPNPASILPYPSFFFFLPFPPCFHSSRSSHPFFLFFPPPLPPPASPLPPLPPSPLVSHLPPTPPPSPSFSSSPLLFPLLITFSYSLLVLLLASSAITPASPPSRDLARLLVSSANPGEARISQPARRKEIGRRKGGEGERRREDKREGKRGRGRRSWGFRFIFIFWDRERQADR